MASQLYAPWSVTCALGHVKRPNPTSEDMVHLEGTWPQFKRQTTSGVGTPTAVQLIMMAAPMSMFIVGGGGIRMVGLAAKTIDNSQQNDRDTTQLSLNRTRVYLQQPISSLRSWQSSSRSQWNERGMHWFCDWHWNSSCRHGEPVQ